MKQQNRTKFAVCIALVLSMIIAMFALSSCSGNAQPVDYSKITTATVTDYGVNELNNVKLSRAKLQLSDGAPKKTTDETETATDKSGAYFYCTDFLVIPAARTTVTLTVTGDLASIANSKDYQVMVSASLNSDNSGFVLNKDGATYAGNEGKMLNVEEVGSTYTFTYVTANANEALCFCFPTTTTELNGELAANDAKISVSYTPSATPSHVQSNDTPWWMFAIEIGIIVLVIVAFYFFSIRPNKKAEKKNAEMRNNLGVGDEITTISGIIGEVVSVKDETVTIETGRDKVQIRILRSAIRSVDVSAAAPAQDDEKSES